MLSTPQRARRAQVSVAHDRALPPSEALRVVRAWDESRIADLAQAYHAMDRTINMPSNWHAALASLDRLADALAVAESATAERAIVAEAFAHAFLRSIGDCTL